MSKLPGDDNEHNEAWDPTDHFVIMHNLVPKQGDNEGAGSNENDSGPSWYIRVDGMDQLGSDDDIDCRPAEACQATEDRDCVNGSATF
jgi:hypothetical protein